MNTVTLPDDIYDARTALGMTQKQFAGHVGVDMRTVRRWENGEVPIPKWMTRMLLFMKCHDAAVKVAEAALDLGKKDAG
jgi:DNA-binding transcriptional regulator YiaG